MSECVFGRQNFRNLLCRKGDNSDVHENVKEYDAYTKYKNRDKYLINNHCQHQGSRQSDFHPVISYLLLHGKVLQQILSLKGELVSCDKLYDLFGTNACINCT